jgi:hypothetical protein
LFAALPDEELSTLAAAAGSTTVPKHGRVFEEGFAWRLLLRADRRRSARRLKRRW